MLNSMSKERRFELLSDRKVMNEGLGTDELWTPEQVKRLVQLEREDARLAERRKYLKQAPAIMDRIATMMPNEKREVE